MGICESGEPVNRIEMTRFTWNARELDDHARCRSVSTTSENAGVGCRRLG
jgi:hypothetical protein